MASCRILAVMGAIRPDFSLKNQCNFHLLCSFIRTIAVFFHLVCLIGSFKTVDKFYFLIIFLPLRTVGTSVSMLKSERIMTM